MSTQFHVDICEMCQCVPDMKEWAEDWDRARESWNKHVLGWDNYTSELETFRYSVARWQNLIPSFPWIAPGWRAWGRNPA